MKFISKSSNLHIILRPGIQAQPIVGAPAKPAISVRFQNGMANVENEELIQMMLAHPAFNGDFISAEDISVDPYAAFRQGSEPAHVVTEMKFGTPQKTFSSKSAPQMPPEVLKLIQEQAIEAAKQMLPTMVAAALKTIAEAQEPKGKDSAPDPVVAPKTVHTEVIVPAPIVMETNTNTETTEEDEYTEDGELIENSPVETKAPAKAETKKADKATQGKK